MSEPKDRRLWMRAFLWLAFLAPFFFLTYGGANALAARRHSVPSVVFGWERHMPFLQWTIVPYWSIDVFYALSLFVCASRTELDNHVRRLVTAQAVAVVCFVLFPLKFAFVHPATEGAAGLLFRTLASFDRPFNQAPSLHIALLIVLWHVYAVHLRQRTRWLLHIWFALIGASVLTTYQHHFFDVPTGALLGFFCLWLWPDARRSPFATAHLSIEHKRVVLAAGYLTGAVAIAVVAWAIAGTALWLLWISVSLLLVALNYAVFGTDGFQKTRDGRMSFAARTLLAPYLLAAFLNSRWQTREDDDAVPVTDDVWIGRFPDARTSSRFGAVVDVTAELPAMANGRVWTCVPMLDLVPPDPELLRRAASCIEVERRRGRTLVCCALGYSRSAAAVATWLVATGASPSMSDAVEYIRGVRARIVIERTTEDAIVAATESSV